MFVYTALPVALLACGSPPPDEGEIGVSGPTEVPWSGSLAPADEEMASPRGWTPMRGIVHLHSPWSHDACDGEPMPDGVPDEECLADLRYGLCTTSMDFAYLSDHPAYAAEQDFEDLFLTREDDEPLYNDDGAHVANRIDCGDGRSVLWMPGIEDELMPVGLARQAGEDAAENDALYNDDGQASVEADTAAGATVLMAHTEGKELADLEALVPMGLRGVEAYNLHAMFDPTKREEDLGLDPMSWLTEIAPFTSPEGTAEPDLFFLAVHEAQAPSLAAWDSLQALGPIIGVAGTDAHQNVLPYDLRDGERGDSYRRMMRWFSNVLLVSENSPEGTDEALQAGRAYIAFEVLGTPSDFDFHLEGDDGEVYEMGSDAPSGTLSVTCPSLSSSSPRNLEVPEIEVRVLKDGALWAEGCGDFATDGPGAYRVEADMTPRHLRDFAGDDPDPWMHSYPWLYSNPIRVK